MTANLLALHNDYIARAKSNGARILKFNAPCCNGLLETTAPKGAKEQWDSLTRCPHCDQLFMKVVTRGKALGHMLDKAGPHS